MDVVQTAIELWEEGQHEEAYALIAIHGDKYHHDMFYRETGEQTEDDYHLHRMKIGAYKIEQEWDKEKRLELLKLYDKLDQERQKKNLI